MLAQLFASPSLVSELLPSGQIVSVRRACLCVLRLGPKRSETALMRLPAGVGG